MSLTWGGYGAICFIRPFDNRIDTAPSFSLVVPKGPALLAESRLTSPG